jgi:hypothetical protein
VGQAFQPAGAGDIPVARHGTGKFREPEDKNVCPTSTWLCSRQATFGVRVKYERIYLFKHATLPALRASLAAWFGLYNDWHPHQSRGNLKAYETAGTTA